MAMELIIPKALQKGDTIAFVSRSARVNQILPTPIERGKSYLEHLGYHIQIIFNTSETKTFRDLVLQRCEEIHEAFKDPDFKDPDIKAIICTVGGPTANELLPHLDYVLIKSNPKIFCGYFRYNALTYRNIHINRPANFLRPKCYPGIRRTARSIQIHYGSFPVLAARVSTESSRPYT